VHPLEKKAQSPQKTSPIEEGWLSLLRWLPSPKLSKVGLFRGPYGRRPTTTGPLGPFFVASLPAGNTGGCPHQLHPHLVF